MAQTLFDKGIDLSAGLECIHMQVDVGHANEGLQKLRQSRPIHCQTHTYLLRTKYHSGSFMQV